MYWLFVISIWSHASSALAVLDYNNQTNYHNFEIFSARERVKLNWKMQSELKRWLWEINFNCVPSVTECMVHNRTKQLLIPHCTVSPDYCYHQTTEIQDFHDMTWQLSRAMWQLNSNFDFSHFIKEWIWKLKWLGVSVNKSIISDYWLYTHYNMTLTHVIVTCVQHNNGDNWRLND